MSAATGRLDALIDDYLAGRLRFMRFWRAFMDAWAGAELSDADREAYAEAHDIVYLGAAGPVAARDATLRLLTEPEVRARLHALRARAREGRRP